MVFCTKLQSRIDAPAAMGLHTELLEGIATPQDIILDCSAVEMIGAAAAQLLVSVSKTLQVAGGHTLKLQNIPQALRNDFATLGLSAYSEG